MKLKGVKPIEQHFEKIIVAVMGVVFVLVLVMQFIGEPNAVTVGRPPQPVPPDQAYLPAQQRAENLKRSMTDPDPALPEASQTTIAQRFESALTEGVSPVDRLAWAPPPAQIEVGTGETGIAQGRLFAEVRPPAPHDIMTAVYMATIDPLFVRNLVREDPETARFFPDQQPFDMAAVTVEASFDGRELQRLLEEDPDGAGEYMPLRANWWRNKVAILQVRLEREELTETGEWTNLTIVPLPPGSFDPLEDFEERVVNTRELETLATTIARSDADRRDVRRAPFLPVLAGPQWRPPSEILSAGVKTDEQIETEALLKEREGVVNDLDRFQLIIDRRSGEPSPRLTQRKENAEERLLEIDERLQELGVDPTAPESSEINEAWIDEIEDALLLSDPAAKIWAHDVTAEPGKTYRYRIGVAINNPAFGRDPIMEEQQLDFAGQRLLIGEMSEWTEPVHVPSMQRYFLVSASRGGPGGIPGAGALGGVKATASVFRFYYGFWRKGSVSLEPGDEIIARVEVPEDLFLFDFDNAPMTEEGEVRPEALVAPQPDEEGDVDYPDWWIEAPRSLPVSIPAQFLDAYEVVGAERQGIGGVRASRSYEAVLTEGTGALVLKRPDDERASADLKSLNDSAKLGETQGQPKVQEQTGPRTLPGGPRQDPGEDRGGGGGGGG